MQAMLQTHMALRSVSQGLARFAGRRAQMPLAGEVSGVAGVRPGLSLALGRQMRFAQRCTCEAGTRRIRELGSNRFVVVWWWPLPLEGMMI